jgi:DNA-binding CsgD family transcriptional regulator
MSIGWFLQTSGSVTSKCEAASRGVVVLSPREKKLLRRLSQGKTDKQISVEIGGREEQIGLQRQRLIERLQIRSQEQIKALAEEFAPWRNGRRET